MTEILTEQAPPGFRESATSKAGLLVPEALSRERETWTRDEWRLIDRVLKLMRTRKLAVVLKCLDDRCQGAEVAVDFTPDGFTWTCEHKTRTFHRQL